MQHYFSISGRTGRIEYITLMLVYPFLAGIAAIVPALLFATEALVFGIVAVISIIIIALGILWLLFTAVIRRMHDLNFSAWWLLILFGLAGYLAIHRFTWPLAVILTCGQMVLCFLAGDSKQNKFGPVPDVFGGYFKEKEKPPLTKTNSGRIDFKL